METPFTPEEVPPKVAAHIRTFCRSIQPNFELLFVPIEAAPESQVNECFENVSRHCKQVGGSIVNGWSIRTWSHVWIAAEHHAVWQNAEGQMTDISPNQIRSYRTLFLPDPNCNYDFDRNSRRAKKFKALRNDPAIIEFFEAEKRLFEYIEQCTVDGTLKVEVDLKAYSNLVHQKNATLALLSLKYLRQSQLCRCGSGIIFGNCHALEFTRLLAELLD